MILVKEAQNWISSVKQNGSIHDEDVIPAITAAMNYCWTLYDRRQIPRNDEAQLGIKWIAALMVSDVINATNDIPAITANAQYRRATYFRAFARNNGALAEILREAAAVTDDESDRIFAISGAISFISPTGLGKSIGRIFPKRH